MPGSVPYLVPSPAGTFSPQNSPEDPAPESLGGEGNEKEREKPSKEVLEPGPEPRTVAPGRPREASLALLGPVALSTSLNHGDSALCSGHQLDTVGSLRVWTPRQLRRPHPQGHRGDFENL